MTNMIKISIVIPVYNVESYIERCVQSVIRQTYTGEMECILVDDCGKDKSIEVAEQLIEDWRLKKGDQKLKFYIVHHERNRGLSAARNTGLDAASGEYVYFLDSDDEMPENAIELMVREVEKHPNIDMVQGAMQCNVDKEYYDIAYFKSYSFVKDNGWIRRNFYCAGKTIPVNGVNKLINVEFLRRNKIFFKEGILHEDEHWMFYLVKHLRSMAFVFEPTYIRYINEGSIMTSSSTTALERRIKSVGIIVLDWLDNIDKEAKRCQIQKILYFYSAFLPYTVWSKEQNIAFISKMSRILREEKQFYSLALLHLWDMIRPIRNVKKILRYSYEEIKRD